MKSEKNNVAVTRSQGTRLLHSPVVRNIVFLCSFLFVCFILLSATMSPQSKSPGNEPPLQGANAAFDTIHTSIVSEFASFNTPGVVDGRVEAIAVDGDTVFVGGTFTKIQEPLGGEIIDQPYLFAYSKSSGDIVRDFDPILNNSVYALATTGEGTGIFAGGVFNIINGETNRRGLVKIDDNGDRVRGFSARPDAQVKTLVRLNNTLYVGGNFTKISQTQVENLAAIDTFTGVVHPGLNLDFDGAISTKRTTGVQSVDDIDITSDGRLMVVIGNFETIDAMDRVRLAVIELDGVARVSSWNTDIYDVQCPAAKVPQYIRGIDIAPDDSYFLVGSQGFRRVGNPACDAITRFELNDLTNTDMQPTWVNYTGGDSVYEVVSTEHAIYVGGHFRWLNNDTGNGHNRGVGSVARAGLAALDPINGLTLLDWQSDRNPRGVGVFALIAEDEGLYIGDDTNFLNGSEHHKLKFLPITSNTISRPDRNSLPATIVSPVNEALYGTAYDGRRMNPSKAIFSSGWEHARGGMLVGDYLFFADDAGSMWISHYNDGTFEPSEPVNLFGLTENEWELSQLGGMFFDYDMGRVYYTKQGNSNLFWRAFTPDGPYFGNDEYIAQQQSDIIWSDVSGMDIIDGYLYYGRTDGNLYRSEVDGSMPIAGTTKRLSGPALDGRNWNNNLLVFIPSDIITPTTRDVLTSKSAAPDAQSEFESSGTDTIRRFQRFDFSVAPGEPAVVRLEWLDSSAILELRVLDANGTLVASDTSRFGSPKWLTVPAGDGGVHSASVLIREGSTSYTLQVNPDEEPPAQPEPLADFEFSSIGSADSGRWQVFNFDVEAGELVNTLVVWDDANADVDVFLRNETNTIFDRSTNGSASPAMLSSIAGTSGEWSVAVRINSGTTNYDVLVDTTTNFVVPEPLADFEFSSSGSADSGRWQVFKFDVEAGKLIDAQVIWDDPNANVDVFLRDETKTIINRTTDSNASLAMLSAIASISGEWSVAVRVNSGSTNYSVLVDSSTDPEI